MGALALSGVAAAATGALPGPLHNVAQILGTASDSASSTASASARSAGRGPDALGPVAYGV